MKMTRCFILTLFTFVIFMILPNSFAQNLRPVVRLIYFLPKDQQPQLDIDTKMGVLIKEVQRVFADEMERHGYGRKTFQIETDAAGKAVLYRVNGQFADAYYQKDWNRVGDEISKKFDLSKNVYVASMETNSKSLCGLGAAHSSMGGSILIPSSGLCFGVGATTHELGHVFGLDHDFRNNLYHMSYGADWEKNQFSQCAAKWLDAHRVFNPSQTAFDKPTTVKMLRPSFVSSSNAMRLQFEVTDPDGLHQAQLKADTTDEDPDIGFPKLIDCKFLSGESTTVEFVTTLLTPKNKLVYLSVMDVHGNFIRYQFPIDVPVQRRPSTVVSIPDANLVAVIQEALDLAPNDPITTRAMSVLEVLRAPNRQITDLTGLEYARKLTVLNLDGNSILDISALSELTQLTNLLLRDNSISDVSPLGKLANLEKLSLGGNPIRNTSPVRTLLRQNPNVQIDINVSVDEPIDVLIDVLIYTGDVWWITRPAAIVEAKTTISLLQSAGIQAKITDSENYVKQWMLQTSSDGSVDVLILYGPIPTTIYPPGNVMPDGSVAENWIETSDGNTILNHADYLGFWSTNTSQGRQQNGAGTLQNLMDFPSIFFPIDRDNIPMLVTADGSALTPSLVNFQSDRAFPLDRLQGKWFAEKVFASNTGNAEATLADPVIVRNGNRGRIAIVHQTSFEDNPKGEVAAEIIINYLLPEPTKLRNVDIKITAPSKELIPDPNLVTAVRNALGLTPNASVTKKVLQRLTKLKVTDKQIKNLTGLEHATQLQELSLRNNHIRDVTPLAGLTQLVALDLTGNRIKDVNLLAGLTQLVSLTINWNQISNLTPLAGLTQLEKLYLRVNKISDVSPLAKLTRLKVLWLDQNEINDVSPLAGLVNLERLQLAENPITDTASLASLTKLVEVDIEITASSKDLIPDANLAAAVREALNLAQNTSITEQAIQRLTRLGANNRQIKDITGLEHATQLAWLNLIGNEVSDVSPLAGLTQLAQLGLSNNAISDVSPLARLTQLEMLHLNSNEISDVTPLAELTRLRVLGLAENEVQDVSPLAGLINLERLRLAENPITDTSSLESLTKLVEVDIEMAKPITEDINADGIVNVQDLVLVATNFGQTGENDADVNADGVVDIRDLVKVAGAFGNAAASPSLNPQTLEMFTTTDVQNWLSQAHSLKLTDATSLQGIGFLEQLLEVLIPKETALLPNYPNPFNPETWIPYQLAKPVDVTVTIYAVNGKVIRQLALGHQTAGVYHSRDRAVYWDSRNTFGEPVASGLYFYTFTAGDFTATRKMLIQK